MSKSEIATAYDNWSGTYESMENATRDLAASALRETGVDFTGKDVLEIGCGTGLNTRYLAEHARSVTAVDFSREMLLKLRDNFYAANVSLQQDDINDVWELQDESVDVVVETLVLEHIEDLGHVFAEAHRVLRADGEFLIYELHPFRQLLGGQAQFAGGDGELIFVPAYRHSISEFLKTSRAAGFTLIDIAELSDDLDEKGKPLPRILSLRLRKN